MSERSCSLTTDLRLHLLVPQMRGEIRLLNGKSSHFRSVFAMFYERGCSEGATSQG